MLNVHFSTYVIALLYAVLNSAAAAFFRKSMDELKFEFGGLKGNLEFFLSFRTILGFLLLLLALLVFLKGLSTSRYSVFVPISISLNIVINQWIGNFFFNEPFSKSNLFGIAFIIFGLFLMG